MNQTAFNSIAEPLSLTEDIQTQHILRCGPQGATQAREALKSFYLFNRRFRRAVDAFLKSRTAAKMDKESKRQLVLDLAKKYGFD
jgi:hypothetical protein